MAEYSPLVQWRLSEAASGTTPTSVADGKSNGNTGTITANSGTWAWTSVAQGNGVDVTHTAGTAGSPIVALDNVVANGNIASTINALNSGSGTQELTAYGVCRIDSANGSYVFKLGSDAGNGLFALVVFNDGNSQARFRAEDSAGLAIAGIRTYETDFRGSYIAYCLVCDSTQATDANRARLYITSNGTTVSEITSGGYTEIPQNAYVGSIGAGVNLSLFDQVGGGANFDGAYYFFEMGTGQPADLAEIEARLLAIYADNDTDPDAASAPPELTAGPTASNITASGFDISGTTDADCTVSLVVVNFGDPQPNDAAFDASTETASATASVEWTINHVGT